MATPKLSDLEPDERNANKGTPRGQKQIVGSVQRNGAGRSGLLDKNNKIVAGNKSTEAFAEVFGEDVEPIIVETDGTRPVYVKRTDLDLDDPDPNNTARKLAYEDNLTSALSFDLNIDVVALDIEAGFDFGEIDITSVDLAGLGVGVENGAGEDTEPQTDRAAELQEKWGTELGQLWKLGEHRLICGDCTDEEIVRRVMGGELADLFLTDPPYNIASGDLPIVAHDIRSNYRELKNSDWDKGFDPSLFLEIIGSFFAPNVSCYICTSQFLAGQIWGWMSIWADFYSYVVWCKSNPMPSLTKRHYTWGTEIIAYATRGKHTFNFPHNGHSLSWWDIKTAAHVSPHPTEKPLAIPERAIFHSSSLEAIVLDCFLGSGTTLIACQNLSRQCRAVEIDPGYVAVTLQRFYDHTGIQPELIEGQT